MTTNWLAAGVGSEDASGDFVIDHPGAAGSPFGQIGDVLVAAIAYRGNAAFTVPAGWTKQEEENIGNTTENTTASIASVLIAYKELVGGDFPLPDNWTFTRTGGAIAIARIYLFRGSPSSPVNVSSSFTMAVAGTDVSPLPEVTTPEDDQLLFMVVAGARNGEPTNFVATSPASLSRIDWFGTLTGANVDIGVALGVKATAGATGDFGVTVTQSARHAAAVIAIRSLPSVSVSPAVVSAAGSVVNPTVKLGSIVLEPSVAAKGAVVAPTVETGSIVASPAALATRGQVVDPVVGTSSVAIEPAAAAASGIVVDPTVKGELIVSPVAVEARGNTSVELIEVTYGPLFSPQLPVTSVWSPQEVLS